MKFGSVEDPSSIDFTLPEDHPETKKILNKYKSDKPFEVYVGCAKWNRSDLKGFYPRGTKDELTYYSKQFNSIELNATFYSSPSIEQVRTWADKTPEGFKFFPKIPNSVSHFKRLINVQEPVMAFADSIANFEDKLGMAFLQMHDNFKPKDFDRVEKFVNEFPPEIPLALELRNAEWFANEEVLNKYCNLLVENNRANIVVDTAGRRDMLHMRLTNDTAFIRYVGANAESDYSRLDDWMERIISWREMGLQKLYFFVHQNIEKESPLLSAYLIKKLNKQFNLDLKIPNEDQ
ncbi:DUF72 domain-containing protein [Echinicola sp. CAU 1574]|uniref:DUF72 domain-containing protein n=1 Tax=Echinicola arenosa TaxID=2774144 RepID=A0ABR9AGK2_9BACT|nr:DUF72 domain-containing protein [Echinicola arenosa]MBD8487861.1 DUF72 domain-containing protein [Echinicola arenosa]